MESLGNALARVQRIHKPVEIWDISFTPSGFEAFNTIETRRFWNQCQAWSSFLILKWGLKLLRNYSVVQSSFLLSTPTFQLSNPVNNSVATRKKATKWTNVSYVVRSYAINATWILNVTKGYATILGYLCLLWRLSKCSCRVCDSFDKQYFSLSKYF